MKKILFGLGFCLLGASFAQAQNGLEGIVVEKYYVANAADNAADPTLPIGATTYRIYADMLPGYKFVMAYGSASHNLKINTTTTFYNEGNYGGINPSLSAANAKKKTAMLDSYLTTGGTCAGYLGVMKSEDDAVSNTAGTFTATSGCLTNTAARLGIPLTTKDGMIAGTVPAYASLGFDGGIDGVFGDGTANGNSFTLTSGAWTCMAGATGPTSSNKVLIAQITTDGTLHYELNIQLGTPTGSSEKYVVNNPVNGEISISSLVGDFGPNIAPTISITSPSDGANIITGDVVAINATAADADGSVSKVEFFINGSSIGSKTSSPYSVNWTSTAGTKAITAVVTDNEGATTTASTVNVTVANNQAPSVSITSPANSSSFVTGDVVAIAASASDVDGTVAQVEFFVDGTSIGVDNSTPYTYNYTSTFGSHTLTAVATDDRGLTHTSTVVTINTLNNVPPTVSLTSPVSGSLVTSPAVVSINATAADVDGTITKVEFFVNNVKVGEDVTSPYSFDWTSVIGDAVFTAKATDNKGAITTSTAVTLSIADPNALPYKVVSSKDKCIPTTFSLALAAVDTIKNVIGYDFVLNYEKAKVTPTGNITKANGLMNTNYFDLTNYVDTANAKINITMYLNSSAPANSTFTGAGNLFSVEFTKKANFKSVDTTILTVSSLQESYYTGVAKRGVSSGKYVTYKDSTFNAFLKYWKDNSTIKYNAANPNDYDVTNVFGTDLNGSSKSSVSVQPDLLGQFKYNIWNGKDVEIERDILGNVSVMSVINGNDVLLAKKVVTADPSFVPSVYQILAMDVNLDGVISAGDISQMNQRILLKISEFKQAWNYSQAGVSNGQPSKDWIFVDSTRIADNSSYKVSSTYPANDGIGYSSAKVPVVPFYLPVTVAGYDNCPVITSETYRGILLADVDGNYANITADGKIKSNPSDKVIFDLTNAVVSQNSVDVPVLVSSNKVVTSLDFATRFNENKLKFENIVDKTSYLDQYSYFNQDDNTLRFTTTTLNKEVIETGKTLVILHFSKIGGEISQSDLQSVEAYVNGEMASLEVTNATGINTIENNRSFNVYPNPASDKLNIEVSENAKVQVLDITGKVVMETAVIANQIQTLEVNNLANGVYTVKVSNDKFVKMQKVVINK